MTVGNSDHTASRMLEHSNSKWRSQAGAALLIAGSLVFMIGGMQLGLGSPFRLGTGAFPFATGLILLILATAISVQEWRGSAILDTPDWISFLAISGALTAFAATAENLGLVPAAFLTIVIASFPDRSLPWRGKCILGGVVSLACWGLFIELLNLPFKPFVGL